MNGSASEPAIFASSGWPASFASAARASSRARAPRRSGEKYRCRKLNRGGCANLALFFSNQLLELGRRRLARGGNVLGQELHLLRHAALDDLVVLVEAHRERLAVEDLLLDLVLDHARELLRRRRAPPLRLVQQGELGDLVERQPDLLRRRGRRASGLRDGVERRTEPRRSAGSGQAVHAAGVSYGRSTGRSGRPGASPLVRLRGKCAVAMLLCRSPGRIACNRVHLP